MPEDDVIITYESLYELLRREKYRPELQKLDSDFYKNAMNYLKEKQAILDSQETRESIFAANGVEKTKTQLRNIQKILKEIYEKREAKVIQLALFNSRSSSLVFNESSLLPEEQAIFGSVRDVLSRFREGILFNILSSTPPSLPVQKEKPLKTTDEINKVEPSIPRIRILAELPEFVGPDMNVYGPFEQGQVVGLPKEVSDILVMNSQAEETE